MKNQHCSIKQRTEHQELQHLQQGNAARHMRIVTMIMMTTISICSSIAHIWRLFDTVFDSLPEVDVLRGEPPSQASVLRKNEKRKLRTKLMTRKKFGRRCDSIIRRVTVEHEPTDELGASEVTRNYDTTNTKVIKEYGLPRMMKAIQLG